MKRNPQNRYTAPDYPSLSDRREFLCLIGKAAVGLAVTSVFLNPSDLLADDAPEITEADLKSMVNMYATQLGDDSFKARRIATKKLIAIGKGESVQGPAKEFAKETVLTAMEKKKAEADPEISERADAIILALTPPAVHPPPRDWGNQGVLGVMIQK